MHPILEILVVFVPTFLLGYLLHRSLDPLAGGMEALALSYPLGGGLLTLAMFLASWMGSHLNPRSVLIVYSLLALPLACVSFLRQRRRFAHSESSLENGRGRSSSYDYLVLGIFMVLALISGILAVGRSYSTWDAIAIWGIKGYAIAHQGSIFAAEGWGSHGLSYPLNIPLQISLFSVWGSDALPASKLIFPAYYFSLLLGVYAFHKEHLGKLYAFMGALVVGTLPIVFMHATMGYANLPFAIYIAFGVLALYQAYRGGPKRYGQLGGILLGLAVWTRPEGLVMTAMIWAAFLTTILVLRPDLTPRDLVLSIVLFLVVILPWQLFLKDHGANPLIQQAPRTALAAIGRADLHLEAFYWIFRFLVGQLIDLRVWGLILPLGFLVLAANYRRIKQITLRNTAPLTVMFIAVGLSMVGYYYLVSFVGDLKFWLGSGVNRMFLPAGIMGAIWVFHISGWADVNESA